MAAVDTTQPVTLASISKAYGWSVEYMKSQPELWRIVQQAINSSSRNVPDDSGIGGVAQKLVRGLSGAEPAKQGKTTLGEFNTMLQGTQWFTQGTAALNQTNTAAQAAAIAQQQGANVTPGVGGGPSQVYVAGQGGVSSPFANLTNTWSVDPTAFAKAKVYVDAGPVTGHPGVRAGNQIGVNASGKDAVLTGAGAYMEQFFGGGADTKTKVEALQTSLMGLGLLPSTYANSGQFGTFDEYTQAGLRAVLWNVSQYNDPNVTVDSYLRKGMDKAAGGLKNRNSTTSRTETDFTSPLGAQAIATQSLYQILGRDPTPQEFATFTQTLHDAQAANPTTTQTTTDSSIDPATGAYHVTNAVKTGGLTDAAAGLLADRQAAQAPDFHAVQAVKFASLLSQMAGAVNSAGSNTSGA